MGHAHTRGRVPPPSPPQHAGVLVTHCERLVGGGQAGSWPRCTHRYCRRDHASRAAGVDQPAVLLLLLLLLVLLLLLCVMPRGQVHNAHLTLPLGHHAMLLLLLLLRGHGHGEACLAAPLLLLLLLDDLHVGMASRQGVQGAGPRSRVQGQPSRGAGYRARVQGTGPAVKGCRVQGTRCRASRPGSRVQGLVSWDHVQGQLSRVQGLGEEGPGFSDKGLGSR